jgi:hypothetical protein
LRLVLLCAVVGGQCEQGLREPVAAMCKFLLDAVLSARGMALNDALFYGSANKLQKYSVMHVHAAFVCISAFCPQAWLSVQRNMVSAMVHLHRNCFHCVTATVNTKR